MPHRGIYFPIRQSGCVGKCMNYFNSLDCPETSVQEGGGQATLRRTRLCQPTEKAACPGPATSTQPAHSPFRPTRALAPRGRKVLLAVHDPPALLPQAPQHHSRPPVKSGPAPSAFREHFGFGPTACPLSLASSALRIQHLDWELPGAGAHSKLPLHRK